jgi:hypothetical protein
VATEARVTKAEQKSLFAEVEREVAAADGYKVELTFDLGSAIMLVGQLQLALRHPHNTGAGAQSMARVIAVIIEHLRAAGHIYAARLAELGNDPENDIVH